MTKWLSSAILDVRNSLFDHISGHFRSIRNYFVFEIFDKMPAGGYFGCLKITFDHISGHFSDLFCFLKFVTKWPPAPILDVRNSLLIAFLAISDRYATFFGKMAAVGHFGCPKFTFYGNSGRSIQSFFLIFLQNAHFGCPKFTFDRISGHFRLICNFSWDDNVNYRILPRYLDE